MNLDAPAPIIVAVDDAGSADEAVEWAAAEAATRNSPLRVVHALAPCIADPAGMGLQLEAMYAARAAAEGVLGKAASRATAVAPEVEVSAQLLEGSAAWALRRETHGAQLLVLGSRARPGGLRGLFTRSVSGSLATRACCPVVVLPHGRRPATGPACVVVGVGRGPSCLAAIGFAFAAARQRRIPLTVVHVCRSEYAAENVAVGTSPTFTKALDNTAVEHTLAYWRAALPGVPVVTKLFAGDPASALLDESAGAALLVVGSRGRRHRIGRLLGAVGQTVLANARSPIAVIRHDHTATAPTGTDHTRWTETHSAPR